MNTFRLILLSSILITMIGASAEDFRLDSKITQVVGDVVHQQGQGAGHPAAVSEVLEAGDLLTTGADSRAELVSSDQTVIRVGSHSVFTFSGQTREMVLEQGSILFHTPHGQGGGIIKTAAITAAVTGSTVAVTTTSSGGAKVVPLESVCTVTGVDGRQVARLNPGQMLAMLPGGKPFVVAIDLAAFTRSSGLIKSFSTPLSTAVQSKINQNVAKQAVNIQQHTGVMMFDDLPLNVGNGVGGGNQPPLQPPPGLPRPGTPFDPTPLPPFTGINGFLFQKDFVTAINMDLNLPPNNPGNFYDPHIQLIKNPDDHISPLEYINQSIGGPTLTNYFTGLMLPDLSLATLGVTPAYPRDFNLPGGGEMLFGRNITLIGVADQPGQSGYPGDPNGAKLSEYQNVGFFGISALGSLTFIPGGPNPLSQQDFSFINAPQYLSLGTAGPLDFEGTQLPSGQNINLNVEDASNFSLGSGGLMTLYRVNINATNANLYLGSLEAMSVSDANLTTNGAVRLYTGADMTLANFKVTNSSSVTMNSMGSIYVQAAFSMMGATNATLTMTAANEINLSPSSYTTFNIPNVGTINLTANTIAISGVHFNTSQTVSLRSASGTLNFNQSVLPGEINLYNVMYAGTTLNSSSTFSSGSLANFSVGRR